jgi:hypothetical protein
LPPVASLFAAFLGENPMQHLLAQTGKLAALTATDRDVLTGRTFFPHLIAAPFHHGLLIVFGFSLALSLIGALASVLRGARAVSPPLPVAARR